MIGGIGYKENDSVCGEVEESESDADGIGKKEEGKDSGHVLYRRKYAYQCYFDEPNG